VKVDPGGKKLRGVNWLGLDQIIRSFAKKIRKREKNTVLKHGVKIFVSAVFADLAFYAHKNNVSSFIFQSLKASFVVSCGKG
jgi:hypothetical protein